MECKSRKLSNIMGHTGIYSSGDDNLIVVQALIEYFHLFCDSKIYLLHGKFPVLAESPISIGRSSPASQTGQ